MTVPYAIPPTAVAGQTLTAANWNTKVRDSLESVARPPKAVAYRNTALAVVNNTVTMIPWLGAATQTDIFWAAGNPTRLTVPAGLGGTYLLTATVVFDINGTGGRHAAFYLNGAPLNNSVNSGGSASWYTGFNLAVSTDLVPGDYVEVAAYHTAGANLNLKADVYTMLFTMTRLGV